MPAGVLIVEDSEPFQRTLAAAVGEVPGLEVVGTASTPARAIELISQLRPAIVVLDLYLTGGTGVDVLKAMRPGDKTKVVVVTGSPSEPLKQACSQLGASFFFDKSLEFEQFRYALSGLRPGTSLAN